MTLRLVVIAGPDSGATFAVAPPGGTIGRGSDAHVKLADVAVGRIQCELRVTPGGIEVVHAGGTNPTRVNGAIVERAPVRAGDELELGHTILRVLGDGDDPALVTVRASSTQLALDTRELVERAPGDAVAGLARLGDALHRSDTPEVLAEHVGRVMCQMLGAARVTLVTRRGAERLAVLGEHERAAMVPQAEVDAAIADGRAAAVVVGERPLLVVPLAPAGGLFEIAGALIAERAPGAPPWQRREVELASAAARLIGASLGAVASRDRVHRAYQALAQRTAAGGAGMIGRSPAMRELSRLIARVAAASTTVLLEGESGTGKERVAEAIHAASARAAGPLIAVNCGALTESLLEGELFGHEKGAFTGATERRAGRFEQADGGTLFLDEIGELSEPAQAKLLRVLETRRFERVGGVRTVSVDVRVIAATHRDLAAMVKAGTFREDLYYRIAVIRATVPPLRDRPEDIRPLAEHFLARFASELGRPVEGFTAAALAMLEQHWWPGNVRELRNVIERAVVLGDGRRVERDDLDLLPSTPPASTEAVSLEDMERAAVVRALESTQQNKAAAAKLLGIDRTTLYKKLRRFGLR